MLTRSTIQTELSRDLQELALSLYTSPDYHNNPLSLAFQSSHYMIVSYQFKTATLKRDLSFKLIT